MQRTNVLFLCSDNAYLSLLAEAYLNQHASAGLHAFSAGPAPAGKLSPQLKKALFENGLSDAGLEPKSWDIFALPHAPQPDYVIQLQRDPRLAQQPQWLRAPKQMHWQISLPTSQMSAGARRKKAFDTLAAAIDRALEAGAFGQENPKLKASA
ncbi:low molecular weight phosphatase family protein [Polycladidibacter hongkongensis]|uniref:arsenate-mycothiol transferase ArsC n=1 Tax=Polycladidibacter hongkongensis TaxID=1647556 RepID=UPI00082E9C4D|nr:hypothetical protein [Pseudovibrio hongkongensis]